MKNKLALLLQWILLVLISALSIQAATAKERIRYHINGPDGSVLRTVDDKGVAVTIYRYSPFGEQLQQKKPANLKAQTGFVGGIHDQQDLVYLKQRYYNPTLGRFYQPDSVTFLQGGTGQINRYQYGWNDPYSFKDPNGTNPDYLAATDPSAYYEMRAIELGNNPYTWQGSNATAKTVQKEAFYDLLGWGVGWGAGKVIGSITAKFESKFFSQTIGSSYLPVQWDGAFATKQLLGTTTTPQGRIINWHAADRMVNPPKGRLTMTPTQVDQVLDSATNIRKISHHPAGDTLTIQNRNMPGSPQVVVDAATGSKVITVINPKR